MEWILQLFSSALVTESAAEEEPRARFRQATRLQLTNQDLGLQIISILKFWRSKNGKRSRRENWTNNRLQKMRTSSRIDQKTWSKAMPPMFQRSRTGNRFQEDELRRNKNAI